MSLLASLFPIDRPASRAAVLWPVLGFAALLAVVVLLAGDRAGAAEVPRDAIPDVLTVVARPIPMESGYSVQERYVGRAESRRSSQLGFVQGGRLLEVRVEEGDAVDAGQVLARLDADGLLALRRELEAQVAEIEARLALARLHLERTRKLVERDSASEREHDEARFEEMALVARLASARAAVERVAVDVDRAELRAPYAGRIVARSADEGVILAPGEPVVELIEAGAMEMRVGVPPEVAARLDPSADYRVDVSGRSVPARVRAVLDEVAADTRTVTVLFALDARGIAVRHGALARLVLDTRREAQGFWLPISALTESRRGLWAAYVVVPESSEPRWHRVERRELSLLHTESDRAFVRGTLRDGESVVLTGVHRLVPDQRVQVEDDLALAVGMNESAAQRPPSRP